ncbi:hypothetical protein Y1Q_0006696 [Alligator mississippiensis]|uniref:Uncharacterized protein n=1 Tax=Alligator mississippiensis TaxID=8496 RepID=A0A151NSQ2_ALLMI|nr:hypothetical protein Y1Q_0006696 [Alligator mississippiensis]
MRRGAAPRRQERVRGRRQEAHEQAAKGKAKAAPPARLVQSSPVLQRLPQRLQASGPSPGNLRLRSMAVTRLLMLLTGVATGMSQMAESRLNVMACIWCSCKEGSVSIIIPS